MLLTDAPSAYGGSLSSALAAARLGVGFETTDATMPPFTPRSAACQPFPSPRRESRDVELALPLLNTPRAAILPDCVAPNTPRDATSRRFRRKTARTAASPDAFVPAPAPPPAAASPRGTNATPRAHARKARSSKRDARSHARPLLPERALAPAAPPAPPTISTVAPAAAPTPTPQSPSTAADAAEAEEPAAAATAHDPATSKAAQPRGLVYDHRGWGDAEALELAATLRAEPSKFADVALLDLSYNEALGDAGLRAIGEAIEAGALPSLESLVLRGCRALTALPRALGRIEALSSLDLFWCANRRTPPPL